MGHPIVLNRRYLVPPTQIMMMSVSGDDDTSASVASFISAVANYAHMNSLLISQHQCIRGLVEEFCSWLVSSEDIDSMSELKKAVADEQYYLNEDMKVGNGQSGVEEERLSVFKRAVLDYLCCRISLDSRVYMVVLAMSFDAFQMHLSLSEQSTFSRNNIRRLY
jgi:hypothetical protein